jgi:hypothetical protein
MKIVCSWCRQEGKNEFVGEKDPFDDVRETHGICVSHRQEVQARWRASMHQASEGGGGGMSSALFHWTGLLNVTKKLRP